MPVTEIGRHDDADPQCTVGGDSSRFRPVRVLLRSYQLLITQVPIGAVTTTGCGGCPNQVLLRSRGVISRPGGVLPAHRMTSCARCETWSTCPPAAGSSRSR